MKTRIHLAIGVSVLAMFLASCATTGSNSGSGSGSGTSSVQSSGQSGSGFHDKVVARHKQSEAVPSGLTSAQKIEASVPYDRAYSEIVTFLKKEDWSIAETTSLDRGQIITEYQVAGGFKQTGTRVVVTLIKEDATKTTIKVAVTEQNRFKLIGTDPWGDSKVNGEKTLVLTEKMKALFSGSVGIVSTPQKPLAP